MLNNRFLLWFYFNSDDHFYAEKELSTVIKLACDHDLENNGWDKNALLAIYNTSQYEIFDNVLAIIFRTKKEIKNE